MLQTFVFLLPRRQLTRHQAPLWGKQRFFSTTLRQPGSIPSPLQAAARRTLHSNMQKPLDFNAGPLVWIDCEMTGLNPRKDKILEIAVGRTYRARWDQVNLAASCVTRFWSRTETWNWWMKGLNMLSKRIRNTWYVSVCIMHPAYFLNRPKDGMDEWCTNQHGSVSYLVHSAHTLIVN